MCNHKAAPTGLFDEALGFERREGLTDGLAGNAQSLGDTILGLPLARFQCVHAYGIEDRAVRLVQERRRVREVHYAECRMR